MSDINQAKIAFWNDLCGTLLVLGITDTSPISLRNSTTVFLINDPYLFDHVHSSNLTG